MAALLFKNIAYAVIPCYSLFFSAATIAHTTQDVETLPAVTIVADAPVTTSWEKNTTTTSLSHTAIGQSGKRDIASTLQGLPGIAASPVNRGFPTRLSIRGSTNALGMVMLDGIPLMSATHSLINLASYSADAIESIDIVRGPLAYRYGSGALGGVIRLTARDSIISNGFFRLEGGSFDTLSETLGASLVGNNGRGTLTLNRDDIFTGSNVSDPALGNTEKDNARNTNILGRYSLYPTDNLELNGTFMYSKGKAELDGHTLHSAALTIVPEPNSHGEPPMVPSNWWSSVDGSHNFVQADTWLAQQTALLQLTPHWQSNLQLGFTEQASHVLQFNTPFQLTSRLLLATWANQHDYSFYGTHGRFGLRWGGDIRTESSIGDIDYNFDGMSTPAHIDQQRTTVAGFMDIDLKYQQWDASLGIRLNHYNDWGSHPNYYMGLGWQPLQQLRLRANAGVGYRVPAINQLVTPFFGNQTLRPERAVTGELGFTWQQDKTKLALTGYYSHYKDMIAFSPNQDLLLHTNLDKVDIYGLELEWRYAPWQNWQLGTDYTYTNAHDNLYHQSLIEVPEHNGRFFVGWQPQNLAIKLYAEGIYASGWQWQNTPNSRIGVGDSFRINAQASYALNRHVSLYLRGENLSNDFTPALLTYGVPGIAVYGGVKFSLQNEP
jgi:vitamin B12 transporter